MRKIFYCDSCNQWLVKLFQWVGCNQCFSKSSRPENVHFLQIAGISMVSGKELCPFCIRTLLEADIPVHSRLSLFLHCFVLTTPAHPQEKPLPPIGFTRGHPVLTTHSLVKRRYWSIPSSSVPLRNGQFYSQFPLQSPYYYLDLQDTLSHSLVTLATA